MRKSFALSILFLLLSCSIALAAPKIAVCDLQKIADQSEPLKDAFKTLEKALTPEKERLDKERAELEKESAILQDPSSSKKDRDDFIDRQAKYMENTTQLLNNVKESEMKVRIEMDSIIITAAEEYAKKNKFDLVLDTQSILYQKDKAVSVTDISNEMVIEVNRLWKEAKK